MLPSLNLKVVHFLFEVIKHWEYVALEIFEVLIECELLGVLNMLLKLLVHCS